MTKQTYFLVLLTGLIGLFGCNKQSGEFIPGELWLDNNGVHVNAHGGGIIFDPGTRTYYWFGEHKTEGEAGNYAQVGVSCYSSKDLYSWKDEGVALAVMPEGSGSPIEKGCILERPKVIYNAKHDHYVMWFHLEPKGGGYSGALSGVAASKNIAGPYTFLKSLRPNAGFWAMNFPDSIKSKSINTKGLKFSGGDLPAPIDSLTLMQRDFKGGQMARDLNLFVDDDDKGYLIYSSEENSTLHIALLNDDYTDCTGVYKRNFPGRFMEAPALFKRNGKYYLIMSGCTGWLPNPGRSATADSIFGEWTELGNPFVGDNSETSFHSQSSYILKVQNKADQFIYMGDRWKPENAIDGRYVWLPLVFENDKPIIRWNDRWKLD